MKDPFEDLYKPTARLFGGLLLLAILLPYEGLVLSIVWKWYIVPLRVPPLSVAHAAGVVVLVQMLFSRAKQKPEQGLTELFSLYVISWTVGLGFAWVIRLFM